jgi:hypothetical protein
MFFVFNTKKKRRLLRRMQSFIGWVAAILAEMGRTEKRGKRIKNKNG